MASPRKYSQQLCWAIFRITRHVAHTLARAPTFFGGNGNKTFRNAKAAMRKNRIFLVTSFRSECKWDEFVFSLNGLYDCIVWRNQKLSESRFKCNYDVRKRGKEESSLWIVYDFYLVWTLNSRTRPSTTRPHSHETLVGEFFTWNDGESYTAIVALNLITLSDREIEFNIHWVNFENWPGRGVSRGSYDVSSGYIETKSSAREKYFHKKTPTTPCAGLDAGSLPTLDKDDTIPCTSPMLLLSFGTFAQSLSGYRCRQYEWKLRFDPSL